MYEIRQVDDMLVGTSLIITIEESELDKKALHTIEESKPGFILPFHARHIDEKIEFVYQVSTLCKLQYITGGCTVTEYVQLWRNVLSPLLECDDWFMKTQSFVLDAEHLYYDKEKKSISFVYIPTKRDCSGYEDLKKMAGELARQIQVIDMVLENKVLRMIMNDFKTKEFLNMLDEYVPEAERCTATLSKEKPATELPLAKFPLTEASPISSPLKELQTNTRLRESVPPLQTDNVLATSESGKGNLEDIIINMQPIGKERKNKNEKKKSSSKNEKRKKKDAKKINGSKRANKAEKQSYDISKNKYDELITNIEPNLSQNDFLKMEDEQLDEATQCVSIADVGCTLRLVGSPLLPSLIRVEIEDGEVFSIGRYDATVGRKQSSFEFERKTKAISRRHAVIKRRLEYYSLIDLSSSAGTFVNGQKLPPNTPVALENGAKISFGTSGADYVWELKVES